VNYSNIGVGAKDRRPIVDLVSGIVFGAALSAFVIVSTWSTMWQLSLIVGMCYFTGVLVLMVWAYKVLFVEGSEMPQRVYNLLRAVPDDYVEPLPDIPKPVYNVARTAPKNAQL